MSNLEQILAPYEVTGQLGGERSFDRDHLRSALATASRQTAVSFWFAVGAQLGLFLLAAWFAIRNASNLKVVSLILAGGGGGVGACCFAMARLWKEKVATDLTLALVTSLDKSAARSVLNVMLDYFRGQRKQGPVRAV